jgi:tRNA pseudouridine55 synthase
MPEGILLVHKPKGMTSHDVINVLRKRFGVRKIGHAGTLDPLASGLMVVGVGEGTKKLKEYVGLSKEYVAEILIGEKRTTGDMEGVIVEEAAVLDLEDSVVRKELSDMIGILRLPVSAYSAVKKGGVPMYKRARKAEREGGVITDVPVRDMEVIEAKLISMGKHSEKYFVTIRFSVGSGTYIRSLAEELGRRLGYPATLFNLKRTKVGEHSIEEATLSI